MSYVYVIFPQWVASHRERYCLADLCGLIGNLVSVLQVPLLFVWSRITAYCDLTEGFNSECCFLFLFRVLLVCFLLHYYESKNATEYRDKHLGCSVGFSPVG